MRISDWSSDVCSSEIKGIARDPAPDRRRSVWRMEYTSASRKLPRPQGPDDGRPAGRAHQAGDFARREKLCRAQRQAEPAKTIVHGGRVNALPFLLDRKSVVWGKGVS